MEIILLDGRRMTSRPEAHTYLAEALRFPSYYGRNLDALADCLSELGPEITVILSDADALRRQIPGYGDRLISVFEEVSAGSNRFTFLLGKE